MTLAHEEVLAWAAEWIYVPDGSPTVDVEEYLLAACPLTWSDPTGAFRISSERSASALVDDVMASAAHLDRFAVTFWISDATRPDGLAAELLARGGALHEELAVLARPLTGPDGLDGLDVPADVDVGIVDDLAGKRDQDRVEVAVFGGGLMDDARLLADLERRDPAAGVTLVARVDNMAVGAAGVTFAGDVARLWGGCVLDGARGRGVYRALLARRLELAREHGCVAALVKGRLTTSAPTLRRAGFSEYGEERGYRLELQQVGV